MPLAPVSPTEPHGSVLHYMPTSSDVCNFKVAKGVRDGLCGPPAVRCTGHCICPRPTYHEVTPEDQGDDLGLRWGIAVVVTGQVPSLPPAVREPVLPVVFGAEHSIQAEEQKNQKDARGQAQSSYPDGREGC